VSRTRCRVDLATDQQDARSQRDDGQAHAWANVTPHRILARFHRGMLTNDPATICRRCVAKETHGSEKEASDG